MKKVILFFSAVIICLGAVSQGDPYYSLYNYQLISFNPATTGIMKEKWRLTNIYRDSYYSSSSGYVTISPTLDINLPINAWGGSAFGAGISGYRDVQGDSRLTNTRINLSFAVGQYLDSRQHHVLSVGFLGGLGWRSITYDDLYWNVQWVREGFDRTIDPNENVAGLVRSYADLSTGIYYSYDNEDLTRIKTGIGIQHFNRPNYALYREAPETELPRRLNVHAQLEHSFREGSMFWFKPGFMYSQWGETDYFMIGSEFQFLFNEGTRVTGKKNEYSMSLGFYHRWKNAVIPMIMFNLAGFSFGASYDVIVSDISQLEGFMGGPEFFISYKSGYNRGLYNQYSRFKKGKL